MKVVFCEEAEQQIRNGLTQRFTRNDGSCVKEVTNTRGASARRHQYEAACAGANDDVDTYSN